MPVQQPPVTNYPTNRAAPDDDRSLWAKLGRARVEALLARGWPQPGRFLTSLRIGGGAGGTTMAAFDTGDGRIIADGPAAGLFSRDRTTATDYFILYKDGTIRLYSNTSGDLWLIDKTTGLIAQDGFTAITYGTNCATAGAGIAASGTRQVRPTGDIELVVSLTATGAVAAGATVATIAAAHRPTVIDPFPCKKTTAAGVASAASGFVTSAGVVGTDVALALGDFLYIHWRYFIS